MAVKAGATVYDMISCSSKGPEDEAVVGEEGGWEKRAVSLSPAQALLS